MKHLLPCTCGQSIPVDVGQAGQQVTCACGRTQEVPTMRGIRALPTAEEAGRAPARASTAAAWSPLQGSLFSFGVLLAFVGLCWAGYCMYVVSAIDVPEPTVEQFAAQAEADERHLDKMPVDELYNIYLEVRQHGLGTPQPPDYVVARQYEAAYTRFAIIGGVLAGVGVLMTAGSFFVRS